MIKIKEPIWDAYKYFKEHKRAVGIAESSLGVKGVELEILFMRKDGSRPYPNKYFISRENFIKYPTQDLRGVKLRIIPIQDLIIIE